MIMREFWSYVKSNQKDGTRPLSEMMLARDFKLKASTNNMSTHWLFHYSLSECGVCLVKGRI